MRTGERVRSFWRASLATGLAACLLCTGGSLYGCRRKRTVRFIEACPVHAEPNAAATVVGGVQPQREYEIIDQKQDWYRIEVFENRNWGWTQCPTTR